MAKKDLELNIWEAVGIRDVSGNLIARSNIDAMSSAELRNGIARAVEVQLANDGKTVSKSYTRGVTRDMQACMKVIFDVLGKAPIEGADPRPLLDAANCKEIVTFISADTSRAVDGIVIGLLEGIDTKLGVKSGDAMEIHKTLADIKEDGYKDFLRTSTEPVSEVEFKYNKRKEKIKSKLIEIAHCSSEQADAILDEKVNTENPIFKNKAFEHNVRMERKENKLSYNGDVRVIDILMYMSKTASNEQIRAFYDNRIDEQNKVSEKGERLSAYDPKRIDNVLGKHGKERTEALIGGKPLAKLQPASQAVNGEPLPEHKWRGYQKLAKLIKETIKGMFSAVQTTGFVERLMKKYKKSNLVDEFNKLDWDADFAKLPDVYKNFHDGRTPDEAKSFFENVQARMLNDKVESLKVDIEIEEFMEKTGISIDEAHLYQTEQANRKDDEKKIQKSLKNALAVEFKKIDEKVDSLCKNPNNNNGSKIIEYERKRRKNAAIEEAKKNGLTDPCEGVEETPMQKLISLMNKAEYLTMRIDSAECVLKEVESDMSDKTLKSKIDKKYFDNQEKRIMNLNHERTSDEDETDFNERIKAVKSLMSDYNIKNIANAENITSETNMVNALKSFKEFNESANLERKQISYTMLADLFGIRDKFATGSILEEEDASDTSDINKNLIGTKDLEDLMKAVSSDSSVKFNPHVVNEFIEKLENGQKTAEECREFLHSTVVGYLQDKFKVQYAQYTLSEEALKSEGRDTEV